MRRGFLAGLAALALLMLGGVTGWHLHRPAVDARAYAVMRQVTVQVGLDEAPLDYVFWGGDSQVELQPAGQKPCGVDFVNGGFSGATANAYRDYVAALRFQHPPRVAALTIGTNDILLKHDPRAADSVARFAANAEAIVARLKAVSPRVVVTALPPVGREIGQLIDAGAVAIYGARLRALCDRLGCTFADPFAAIRDGETGYAKPGTLRDGLHLAAYRKAMAALEPALCER